LGRAIVAQLASLAGQAGLAVLVGLFVKAKDLFFDWNPIIFVTKEPMQKFETLRQPLLGF
jgi:hypothetical protein